jgi:hypothetical protein
MSLINDALKRAKESQKNETPAVATPMPPVENRPPERTFSWLMPAVIILLVATAFLFIGLAVARHNHPIAPPVTAAVTTPPVAAPIAPVAPVAPAPKPPVIETLAPAPVTNLPVVEAPVTNTPAPPAETITAAPQPEAPKIPKIQGIAYDPQNAWAIVNGQTVYVGDEVDGFRVLDISRKAVTLAGNGQTNSFAVSRK